MRTGSRVATELRFMDASLRHDLHALCMSEFSNLVNEAGPHLKAGVKHFKMLMALPTLKRSIDAMNGEVEEPPTKHKHFDEEAEPEPEPEPEAEAELMELLTEMLGSMGQLDL